jgi:hypothetical protein
MDKLKNELVKLVFKGYEDAFTKEARYNLLNPAISALAVGASIMGFRKLDEAYQDYKLKKAKDPAFAKMLEIHPQLKKFPIEEVMKYYDSLYHFAPHMAEEPLAAGAYVLQTMRMADFGGPTIDSVESLAKIQSKGLENTTIPEPYLLQNKAFNAALGNLAKGTGELTAGMLTSESEEA